MVLPNFEHLNTHLPGAALKATRNAALLPVDIAFHKSMDADFAADLDAFSSKVLSLTNQLLALSSTIDSAGKGKGKLQSEDDVLDRFESIVVDRVDALLERVDSSLDAHLGRVKAPAITVNPIVEKKKPTGRSTPGQPEAVVQHAAHLDKPQLSFKIPVDNSNSPWYPRLNHKYHATVPLGYEFVEREEAESSRTLNSHPYRYEIKHLAYPPHMFRAVDPTVSKPFDATSSTWVETTEGLQAMLDKLRSAPELAVDLEHHSYRTYSGFLCLMQISTRDEDWIIDTIALRAELEVLNEVFADPKIVKVFHGADSDIVWLQQDLNLYIVNLFDTYQASKALSFPKHGLANLLEMYCDFTPDKRYQLADWRVRPLPEAMSRYARSDTHFLLYIYDNLRNALLDRGRPPSPSSSTSSLPPSDSLALLKEVLSRSEDTSLKVYEKEMYDASEGGGSGGWDNLARKWNKMDLVASAPDSVARHVYRAVHAWRDRVAREEDESTRYVLPNHFLFQLAEIPPPDMPALLRFFHSPPPVIKRRARELLDVVRDAVLAQSQVKADAPVSAQEVSAPQIQDQNDVVMEESAASEAASTLWSNAGVLASAPTSSLFGSALQIVDVKKPPAMSAKTSSLFGSTSSLKSAGDVGRFQDVLNKIHGSLSISPAMPQVQTTSSGDGDEYDPKSEEDSNTMQVDEMPFIPASQRAKREVIEDTLVVVGQAKVKKRKRTATASGSAKKSKTDEPDQEPEEGGETKAEAEDDAPFDFASAPNPLDQVPGIHTDGNKPKRGKGKQKGKKGGTGYTYGDFPAPPRAQSDLKSGNQSHSFGK